MYKTLCRVFYWRYMAKEDYQTVLDCRPCSRARRLLRKHNSFLNLFPVSDSLEFISMNLLFPFSQSLAGSASILVLTYRYSKLARTIARPSATASVVDSSFMCYLVSPYVIPDNALTYNGPQFVADLFYIVCAAVGNTYMMTTSNHPHTKAKRSATNEPSSPSSDITWQSTTPTGTRLCLPLPTLVTRRSTYMQVPLRLRSHCHTTRPAWLFPRPETASSSDSERPPSRYLHIGLLNKLRHLFVVTYKRTDLSQQVYKKYFDRKPSFPTNSILQLK